MTEPERPNCPSLLNFILIRGMLIWGLSTAALVTLWQVLFEQQPLLPTLRTSLIAYPLSGIPFGLFLWWYTRKNARKP